MGLSGMTEHGIRKDNATDKWIISFPSAIILWTNSCTYAAFSPSHRIFELRG